jgi:hypothetical protein
MNPTNYKPGMKSDTPEREAVPVLLMTHVVLKKNPAINAVTSHIGGKT